MRITVDHGRCEGHGMCEERAPDLFRLDDEGLLSYRFEGVDLPEEQTAAARAAVTVCPVAALRVH